MIKSLITGPGFVASHLADLLLEKGEEVYITSRWTDDKRSFEHIKDKVHWIAMDLNDAWSCLKAIEEVKPDYIYHLGAQSSVPESFAYPAQTIQTNIIGTLNLLEAVRIVRGEIDYDFKNSYEWNPVIHVCSSSEVYGVVKEEDQPIKETTPFNPANPYAVSKVGEDQIALMYHTNYGLKTIRTRFFTHTGPRRVMMSAECFYAKRIAEIEKEIIESPKHEYIIKLGNMESIRTWADVRDAVRAYYLLARSGKYGEVFNVGGDNVCDIRGILEILLFLSKIDRQKIKFETDPKLLRPYDVKKQTVDISKLKSTIDWKPEIPLENTLLDLLNDWRNRL